MCESAFSNFESNQDIKKKKLDRIVVISFKSHQIEYVVFRIRIESNQNKIDLAKIRVKNYNLR